VRVQIPISCNDVTRAWYRCNAAAESGKRAEGMTGGIRGLATRECGNTAMNVCIPLFWNMLGLGRGVWVDERVWLIFLGFLWIFFFSFSGMWVCATYIHTVERSIVLYDGVHGQGPGFKRCCSEVHASYSGPFCCVDSVPPSRFDKRELQQRADRRIAETYLTCLQT